MSDDKHECFIRHGRFGRKPRVMSGMAASLLRTKTFQDSQQREALYNKEPDKADTSS